MNREDIIRMAREAGLLGPEDTAKDIIEYGIELWLFGESGVKALERFALNIINANQPQRLATLSELIRNAQAAEREACAKVCEAEAEKQYDNMDIPLTIAADLIRARGQA